MRKIITDKDNNEYVYVHFIGEDTRYFIPYIDKKYWEYHFVPKNTWILINKNTNFDNFNISKDDFNELIQKDKDSYKEILKKYHNSF